VAKIIIFVSILAVCVFAQPPVLEYVETSHNNICIYWDIVNLPDSAAYRVILNNRPWIYEIMVDSLFSESSQIYRDSLINELQNEPLRWYNPNLWEVTLTWTAPGDDSTVGTATTYDIRYRETPFIDSLSWLSAQVWATPPIPDTAGSLQTVTITGLTDTLYYFAIKAVDESGNWSNISNIAFKCITDNNIQTVYHSFIFTDNQDQVIWADTIHYAVIDFYYMMSPDFTIQMISNTVKIDSLVPAIVGKAYYRTNF